MSGGEEVPEPALGDPGPGARTPILVLAVAVAVVFAGVSIVLGVLLAAQEDGEGSRVAALRRTAGQVAEAILTYDAADPDAHRDAVLDLATGSFRSEYEDAFDEGLRVLITELQASSEGFAKEVFVSAIDEERAEAVVVADVTRDGPGGSRTLRDLYLLLAFVEVDGAWKVDQVTDLNLDAGASPGVDPGSTTSTSAPIP